MKTVKLIAPAKVNLFLGIGECREDGYHDAVSVMQALALHDTLTMTSVGSGEHVMLMEPCDAAQPLRQCEVQVREGDGLSVEAKSIWCEGIVPIELPSADNLACRAVMMLAQAIGRTQDECIRIVVEKHIPYQAGLGGGSADAAAALVGAASLWGLSVDDEAVRAVARRLGADVRFFLHGGCVLLEGRGDEFVRSLAARRDSVVIIRPDSGVSTAEAYRMFDAAPQVPDAAILQQVHAARTGDAVPLFNNLEAPSTSLLPELADIRAFARQASDVRGVLLCGSGSATFAVCGTYAAAQALSAAAQSRGYWARATSFSGIRAAQLPS
jgi:4-diphosphocytidyl-2-C-methyl-D-erythritol kinase